MPKLSWLCFLILVFASPQGNAQSTANITASDPQAIAFASSALTALDGSLPVSDITLTGTATLTSGSAVDSGAIVLKAFGMTDSSLSLDTPEINRYEIRNTAADGTPQGFWIGPDGAVNSISNHNCFTDAAWFFPPLTVLSQASNPTVLVTYIGQETRGGASVQHLRFVGQFPNLPGGANSLISSLTTEDVYLGSASLLPVAILFNTHPDNDAGTNIPVEIDFSNYQSVSGVLVPFSIQKLLNGSLFLEITVQSATLNSGLSGSAFTAQ